MASRERIRCKNPGCPSAKDGGRILAEYAGAVHFIELTLGNGKRYRASFWGPWVSLECPSCGEARLNPDLAASDGIGGVIERTLAAVAERARETQAEHQARDRRRLRRSAA